MFRLNLKIQTQKKQHFEIFKNRADHEMVNMSDNKQNY